jgi:hypothetical protein
MKNINRFWLHASRRAFLGGMASASAIVGAGLLCPLSAHADHHGNEKHGRPNAIPGGGAPFKPFGIFVHHNALNSAVQLANISDPSQITDFNGLVGLTHIRGAGTGTNTTTGETTALAYQADMGFSQGEYIGTDGDSHQGTFVFV